MVHCDFKALHHYQPPMRQLAELLSNRTHPNNLKWCLCNITDAFLKAMLNLMIICSWFIFLVNCFLVIFSAMAEIRMCEPFELYNLLNRSSRVSRLAEINFLCLIGERWNEAQLQRLLLAFMWPFHLSWMCLIALLYLTCVFLDARETEDYRISHIRTARNVRTVWTSFYPQFWDLCFLSQTDGHKEAKMCRLEVWLK